MLYNVVGGGESHLYGTEGALFYLRNGFNNFNFCFILALLFLGVLPVARKKYAPDLLIVVSSFYIWLGFMSLQPHKEERYVNREFLVIPARFFVMYFFIIFNLNYATNLCSSSLFVIYYNCQY